ncbi:MAG: hypothetical protein GXP13_01395 [Gammaproteobacteria bacterium]|nr:hypothetical protein [Gammaproteobacteria bacterium]
MTMNDFVMNDIPKWDIALENLANEEFKTLGHALDLADFKQMGKVHRIRFDDLMHTLCKLVENNEWSQKGVDCTEADLEELFVYDRLDEKIAEKYSVTWELIKK